MMDEEIDKKLDLIIKLLALNVLENENSQKDDIVQLARVGIQPKYIAEIIGTTSNTVNVTLSRARKEGLLE